MQLYRKIEYVLAMPAHQPGAHTNDPPGGEPVYAIQACDQNGKPLSSHLQFLSKVGFESEYTPVRRRPKPVKAKAPARPKQQPKPNNKPQEQLINVTE